MRCQFSAVKGARSTVRETVGGRVDLVIFDPIGRGRAGGVLRRLAEAVTEPVVRAFRFVNQRRGAYEFTSVLALSIANGQLSTGFRSATHYRDGFLRMEYCR